MAFDSAITHKTIFGNKRVHNGTWTGSGATGGNINTGLRMCQHMTLTVHNSAVTSNQCTVNESLPVAGSAVTIAYDSGINGYWIAYGE